MENVKKTNLSLRKRNVINLIRETMTKAASIDRKALHSYIEEIIECKSTVQLNRKIKYMNKVWKNLNIHTYQ